MQVDFDTDQKLLLPKKLFFKNIKEYCLVLAPELPNWLVLEKKELSLLKLLQGNTIWDSLVEYQRIYKDPDEIVIKTAESILGKIESSQFYENAFIEKEEAIENIHKNIHINLTNKCNLRCKHCFVSAGIVHEQTVNFEKLKKTIDSITQLNGKVEIVFSGGEPLLYNDIFPLLEHCKNLGHKIILFTNGLLINSSNIKIIKRLVDELQLSMEGITQKYFESIRGNNTYDKFIQSLRCIKKCNIPLTLAVTIIDSVIDDVENNLLQFLEDFDYKQIQVRVNEELEHKGSAIEFPDSYFAYNFQKKMKVAKLLNCLREHNYIISPRREKNIRYSNCGIGASIVIDANGKIYPCNELYGEFGEIDTDMENILINFTKLNKDTEVNHIEKCMKCELKYICNGGCKIKNLMKNGSYLMPGCSTSFKESKYYELFFDSYSF